MGGSGDYFNVADTVIMMDNYRPILVTEKAKEAINSAMESRTIGSGKNFGGITHRCPVPSSIDPYRGRRVKVRARGLDHIIFGAMDIDLSAVEQIVSPSQVNTISEIIVYALGKEYIDGNNTIMDILDLVFSDIEKKGLEILSGHDGHPGSFAYARKFEVAAAINRLRSLQVEQK